MRNIFVTGIGTDVGKTVVSAILVEALQADYWKPVQCGSLDYTDTLVVRDLVGNSKSVFHPEAYLLTEPMSPHAAAIIDGVQIKVSAIHQPITNNQYLIIEPAGGLMVPLNDTELVIDLIQHFEAEVVLVSQNYLGSINHTILSVEALKARGLSVLGIIFNGEHNESSENFILQYSGFRFLGRVDQEKEITPLMIQKYVQQFRHELG
ncbi:MAG: dethiobiotin synthase [Flavobacteriales bacterium]|nr:MAG: dethiobiotin synthase [Flavobacteriales bacterium]